MKYEPKLDYGRKRGLLEEINRSVQEVEQETALRGAISHPRGVEAGSVDIHPTTD